MKFVLKVGQVSAKKFNLVYFEHSLHQESDVELSTLMDNYTVLASYPKQKDALIQLYAFCKNVSPELFEINRVCQNWLEFTPKDQEFMKLYEKV